MKAVAEHQQDMTPLFAIEFEAGFEVDDLLAAVAAELKSRGLKVAGLVQRRGRDNGDCHCRDMHLRDLETGVDFQISEERGSAAQGCHLDWQAIMALALRLEEGLSTKTDVLIINRFGRSESEGRGFRGVIEKAIELNVAVIVAVRSEYAQAWADFHGGMAHTLHPDADTIFGAFCSQQKKRMGEGGL